MIEPSFAEVLRRLSDRTARDVWTSMPGRIVSYDATKREADVLPVVRQPLGGYDDEPVTHEALPVLPGVPVVFPAGGGCSVVWTPTVGDHVLLVFSCIDPGAWRRSGEVSDAGTTRRHGLGGAWAIPGVAPRQMGLSAPVGLELDGPEITIGTGATHPIARGDAVVAWLDAIMAWVATSPSPPPTPGPAIPPTEFPTTADCLSPKGKVL